MLHLLQRCRHNGSYKFRFIVRYKRDQFCGDLTAVIFHRVSHPTEDPANAGQFLAQSNSGSSCNSDYIIIPNAVDTGSTATTTSTVQRLCGRFFNNANAQTASETLCSKLDDTHRCAGGRKGD